MKCKNFKWFGKFWFLFFDYDSKNNQNFKRAPVQVKSWTINISFEVLFIKIGAILQSKKNVHRKRKKTLCRYGKIFNKINKFLSVLSAVISVFARLGQIYQFADW